jgi:hypothetical protein
MLAERMIARDISGEDNEDSKFSKLEHITKRLEFASEELKALPEIRKTFTKNPLSKEFTINDDSGIYIEVIPYILSIV